VKQQRVLITKALVNDPKLQILDESTTVIYNDAQYKFYALFQKLNKTYNLSIILPSYNLDAVSKIANKIAYSMTFSSESNMITIYSHILNKIIIIMTIIFQLDLIQQSMNEIVMLVYPFFIANNMG
jgi:ABC-type dipeptide/oligopeptide/nickel transport system ATPase subunit